MPGTVPSARSLPVAGRPLFSGFAFAMNSRAEAKLSRPARSSHARPTAEVTAPKLRIFAFVSAPDAIYVALVPRPRTKRRSK